MIGLLATLWQNKEYNRYMESVTRAAMEREMKLRVTEHNDHLVEYELESGDNGERCYLSVVKSGNTFAFGMKTQFDEVEEFLNLEQAAHLSKWLAKWEK